MVNEELYKYIAGIEGMKQIPEWMTVLDTLRGQKLDILGINGDAIIFCYKGLPVCGLYCSPKKQISAIYLKFWQLGPYDTCRDSFAKEKLNFTAKKRKIVINV